jgi:hypothetical protein
MGSNHNCISIFRTIKLLTSRVWYVSVIANGSSFQPSLLYVNKALDTCMESQLGLLLPCSQISDRVTLVNTLVYIFSLFPLSQSQRPLDRIMRELSYHCTTTTFQHTSLLHSGINYHSIRS